MSADVDAARRAMLNRVTGQKYDDLRHGLDAFEAAIRAEGLDVERLAEIMAHSGIYDEGLGSRRSAEHVAAEYARLAGADRE